MFRFVHTADVHLDSPLKSLAFRDPDMARTVGNATRDTFSSIVGLCIEEKVDALIIAGDLYDRDQTSFKTARFLIGKLEELHRAGIRTFIIRGNHDSGSSITKQLVVPESVKIFSTRPESEVIEKDNLQVAIHGLSFPNRHIAESLLHRYPPPVSGSFNIGILHTSLGGSEGHDLYAPCSVQDLQETGYDYWALGHIHKPSCIRGDTTIVMPGIPQGRHIGEAGKKTIALVSVPDDGRCQIECRNVSKLQFELMDIDVSSASDWRGLVVLIDQSIRFREQDLDNRILVLRLRLAGQTGLSWQIRRDLEVLLEEARRMVEDDDRIWIETIRNATVEKEHESDRAGLFWTLHDQILQDDQILKLAWGEFNDYSDTVIKTLPAASRKILGDSDEERAMIVNELAREGAEDVLASLRPTKEGAES